MKFERKEIGRIKFGRAVVLVKEGQTYLFKMEGAEILEDNRDEQGFAGIHPSETQGVPEEDPQRIASSSSRDIGIV